jgi:hypothetical protein
LLFFTVFRVDFLLFAAVSGADFFAAVFLAVGLADLAVFAEFDADLADFEADLAAGFAAAAFAGAVLTAEVLAAALAAPFFRAAFPPAETALSASDALPLSFEPDSFFLYPR